MAAVANGPVNLLEAMGLEVLYRKTLTPYAWGTLLFDHMYVTHILPLLYEHIHTYSHLINSMTHSHPLRLGHTALRPYLICTLRAQINNHSISY